VSCFYIIPVLCACYVNRLTIVQAKLVDDKQKLLQGAGGKLDITSLVIIFYVLMHKQTYKL